MAEAREMLRWGNVPVPYAALWSSEVGRMHVAICPHIGKIACCDVSSRGDGKPVFGKPHMGRQREVIVNDLCDLCAKPLRLRTKVSLSHTREIITGAQGMAAMQVEPLLHKDCAAECVEYCPSLKRDIARGVLKVAQVFKHRHQVAILTEDAVKFFTGERMAGVAGHAKVDLMRWKDRDLEWLTGAQP